MIFLSDFAQMGALFLVLSCCGFLKLHHHPVSMLAFWLLHLISPSFLFVINIIFLSIQAKLQVPLSTSARKMEASSEMDAFIG